MFEDLAGFGGLALLGRRFSIFADLADLTRLGWIIRTSCKQAWARLAFGLVSHLLGFEIWLGWVGMVIWLGWAGNLVLVEIMSWWIFAHVG